MTSPAEYCTPTYQLPGLELRARFGLPLHVLAPQRSPGSIFLPTKQVVALFQFVFYPPLLTLCFLIPQKSIGRFHR